MFSEESNFQVFRVRSTTTVRHPRSSDRFDPRYTVTTVKTGRVCYGVGEFMKKADLYFFPTNRKMNADAYLKVLQGPMLKFFHIHECEVFMLDSAPCHKAKKVKKFFRGTSN